jgi:hypothetical protein
MAENNVSTDCVTGEDLPPTQRGASLRDLPRLIHVAVAEVQVGEGRRRLEMEHVARLSDAMEAAGQLDPIWITPDHRLIAGHHRLEAARQLEWLRIKALVLDLDEIDAAIAEIDENLLHRPLMEYDLAQALARRKQLGPLLKGRLAVCRALGDSDVLFHALGGMGHLARDEGDYAHARSVYAESLLLRRRSGHQITMAPSLEDFAVLAGRERQPELTAGLQESWGMGQKCGRRAKTPGRAAKGRESGGTQAERPAALATGRERIHETCLGEVRPVGQKLGLPTATVRPINGSVGC